jgi:hypothetical protein
MLMYAAAGLILFVTIVGLRLPLRELEFIGEVTAAEGVARRDRLLPL